MVWHMPKNMPICLALFGATDDQGLVTKSDGSNRRNIERRKVNYKLLRYLEYMTQSREYTHKKGHKARKKRERQNRRKARSR